MTGLMLKFAYQYTDENRKKLKEFTDMQSLSQYLVRQNLVEQFATFGDKNGLKRRNLMINRSRALLERFINARIIYNILDESALTEYLNQFDPVIDKTIGVFERGEAFPKKPEPEANASVSSKQKKSSSQRK